MPHYYSLKYIFFHICFWKISFCLNSPNNAFGVAIGYTNSSLFRFQPGANRESPDTLCKSHPLNLSDSMKRKKRGSLFKRHRRTPSSPARLVSHPVTPDQIVVLPRDRNNSVATSNPCELMATVDMSMAGEIDGNNCEQMEDEHMDVQTTESNAEQQQCRRSGAADGSIGLSPLRRGKPNTVTSGLPPNRYIPSPDRSRRSGEAAFPKEHFYSPESCLSPSSSSVHSIEVAAMENPTQDNNSQFSTTIIYAHPNENNTTNPVDESVISENLSFEESPAMNTSGISVLNNSIVSGVNGSLDHAFIGEQDSPNTTILSANQVDTIDDQMVSTSCDNSVKKEKVNRMEESETSDSSVCTVIYNGKQVINKHSLRQVNGESIRALPKPNLPGAKTTDPALRKYTSCNIQKNDLPVKRALESNRRQSVDPVALRRQHANRKVDSSESNSPLMPYLKNPEKLRRVQPEGREAEKSPDVPFIKGAEVNLPLHTSIIDLQEANAGKVAAGIQQFDQNGEGIDMDKETEEIKARHNEPHRFPNSTLRRPSPVRIPTIFAKKDKDAQQLREMARSVIRSSPKSKAKATIPISTNLVQCSSVEHAVHKLSTSSNESGILDITDGSDMVLATPKPQKKFDTPGHTPMRLPSSKLKAVDLSASVGDATDALNSEQVSSMCNPVKLDPSFGRTPLRDTNNPTPPTPLPLATPKIKAPIIPTDSISKRLLQHTPARSSMVKKSHCRSPVKPVKRLATAVSPRRPLHGSPRKGHRGLSPIPNTGIETTF